MTSANQMPEVDPLAGYDKRPAVSFDPSRTNEAGEQGHAMGEIVTLQVDGYATFVPRRDAKTKQPMTYDDGNPMMSMVLPVKERNAAGEWVDKSLWSKKPGGLLIALIQAQTKLVEDTGDKTRRIRPGDELIVRWSANGPKTSNDPMMNAPKLFQAKVKPGVEPAPAVDPFEDAASNPTPAPRPAASAPQAQAPAAATPPPAVGGDPWADTPSPVHVVSERAPQPSQPAAAAPAANDDPFGPAPTGEGPSAANQGEPDF